MVTGQAGSCSEGTACGSARSRQGDQMLFLGVKRPRVGAVLPAGARRWGQEWTHDAENVPTELTRTLWGHLQVNIKNRNVPVKLQPFPAAMSHILWAHSPGFALLTCHGPWSSGPVCHVPLGVNASEAPALGSSACKEQNQPLADWTGREAPVTEPPGHPSQGGNISRVSVPGTFNSGLKSQEVQPWWLRPG